MRKSKSWQCVRAAVVLGSLAGAALGGCSSSADEERRASQLAGGCIINSDCQKDLICAFERCHEACTEDRDCDADLRCVKSEATNVFVCQLDDEVVCKADKDCPGDQVCGVDQECRDPCQEDDDCVGEQICANSDECASTLTGKDDVDARGCIVPDDSTGEGGTGGGSMLPSGDGGNGSGGVPSQSTGGTETAGGTGALGGEASQAGGMPSEGGNTGNPSLDYEEQPGAAEPIPNDRRQDAIPLSGASAVNIYLDDKPGAGLPGNHDQDWFAYKAPDDGRAHVIIVRVEQATTLSTWVQVYAAADGTLLDPQPILNQGTLRYLYVTAGSGATIWFAFHDYTTSGGGMALITFEDRPENDEHEPNNTFGDASPIELDQPVYGQLLNPMISENDRPRQDWYSVYLEAGPATFKLITAPQDGRLAVQWRNLEGIIDSVGSPVTGATATYAMSIPTAGTYQFNVGPNTTTNNVDPFVVNDDLGYLHEQYSFTITQP